MSLIACNPSPRYIESSIFDLCCHSAHDPKGSQGWNDTNYCTVNAAAAAFNIVWSEAHKLLASVGRKNKRGVSSAAVIGMDQFKAYGEVREAVWLYNDVGYARYKSHMTLRTLLRKVDPSKRYWVTVSRHALAVIGEKVRGENNLNRRVRKVWEVTPHLQRPGAINLPVLVKKNLTAPVACAMM